MPMGLGSARNHRFRNDLAFLYFFDKHRFGDWSDGLRATKKTLLHEIPVSRHRSSPSRKTRLKTRQKTG